MNEAARKYSVDISALDQLIRDGQLGLAREQLLAINIKSIDRNQILEVANLARRLNMPKLMIKFLKPIVRSPLERQAPATDSEIALYATALSRLGVFAEAEKLLKGLDGKKLPEVHLYHAMNDMFQWDYVSPIPNLKKYVQSKSISDYERLVGYVNIAASYIWNMQWEKGRETVHTIQAEISRSADPRSHRLIHGYSFELLAEMSILQKEFKDADVYLSQAQEILQGSKSRYEFFIKKWKTISETLQSTDLPKNLVQLRTVRDEAIELKDWETYRDCEFYEAVALRDSNLFLKVYHGTPYHSYRVRVSKIFQPDLSLSKKVMWNLSPDLIIKTIALVSSSENPPLKLQAELFQQLESKPLLENLFSLLCRDYYRPLAFGSLVSQLYPNEYFNPESSPQKAWQIIDRLRDWFKEQNLPLDIQIHEETCRLIALQPCQIPIQEIQDLNASEDRQLIKLKSHFKDRPFGAQEVSDHLGISKRSAQKLCQTALQSKKIVQTSAGRTTRYKFRK